jgi:two-component system, sensor histidine kinase and response regulator
MEYAAKRPIKILIVEDSRTQAEYLRHILEDEGYRVMLAENGHEALEQIGADRPSLILSDIVMPEMNGYELARRVKDNPGTASIPVILVTQLFDPVDVIRGLEAGADDFIIKPYDSAHIRTHISSILKAMGQPDPDGDHPPLQVTIFDGTHRIPASRLRILRILLSTYEVAVRKNVELEDARERLNAVNDQLQQAVVNLKKSNADLEGENSERRRVEKALDEANRKLNLMASITRHDILNQLTTQHEYLESALSLREKDADSAWAQVSSAKAIADQTINAVRFTGDYQKIGVKNPVWQDLDQLISSGIRNTHAGTVTVENRVPAGVQVFADPLIRKIFSNLIENAVKYGVSITKIRFSMVEQDGTATITCEDDGIGISPECKEKIFMYEYGMKSSLGLFLAREILALTGIGIRETGTFHKGARFEISCPPGTFRHV